MNELLEEINKLKPYITREFSFRDGGIKVLLNNRQHKCIKYINKYDGNEFLHYSSKFGYTDFCRKIDRYLLGLGSEYHWVNEEGNVVIQKRNQKGAYIEGMELILYDNLGNVTFDEWVYLFQPKGKSAFFADMNGMELIIDKED